MLGSKRIPIARTISGATHAQFQKTSLINPEPHSGTKDASAPGYARNRKPLGKSSRACARRRRSLVARPVNEKDGGEPAVIPMQPGPASGAKARFQHSD